MDVSSPLLWAAWAAFALVVVLATAAIVRAAASTPLAVRPAAIDPGAPWLYCEEGEPLDRETQWFRVRPGGKTVLGSLPRSATADTTFIYLNAHDVARDNALIGFDPERGRYRLEAPAGATVRHNNEDVLAGAEIYLTDGDTLEIGRLSRFRFTMTGPSENGA